MEFAIFVKSSIVDEKALESFENQEVPLILITSDTAEQAISFVSKHKIGHPFVVKDGESIYIPRDYFDPDLEYTFAENNYLIIETNGKTAAVRLLTQLFKKKFGPLRTVGIGIDEGDFDMLDNVDMAYLIKKGSSYASDDYIKAEGFGSIVRSLIQ